MQGSNGFVNFPHFGVVDNFSVKAIGGVVGERFAEEISEGWVRQWGCSPGVNDLGRFAKVGKGNDIADVIHLVAVVGNPDFQVFDFKYRADLGHIFQAGFEIVAIVKREEEVSVFVVLVSFDFKFLDLAASLELYILALGFLLGANSGKSEVAKLKFGFEAKKALSTLDKRTAEGKAYVAGLYFFEDFVFAELVCVVVEFNLVIEIEDGISIEIGIQVEFFPDFSRYVHLDIHIEIEAARPALPFREDWVIEALIIAAKGEVNIALRADIHGGAAKKAVNEAFLNIEFGKGVFRFFLFFAVMDTCELPKIGSFVLFAPIFEIFLEGHIGRRAEKIISDALIKDIAVGFGIVFYVFLNSRRILEVNWIFRGIIYEVPFSVPDRRQGIFPDGFRGGLNVYRYRGKITVKRTQGQGANSRNEKEE